MHPESTETKTEPTHQEHAGEKQPVEQQQPISKPYNDELVKRQQAPEFTKPQAPPKAAELDQDPGAGFNPDHTIMQP